MPMYMNDRDAQPLICETCGNPDCVCAFQEVVPRKARIHVTMDEAIYGTLWRSGNLNMAYETARKYALAAIGGKGSEAQRRAIEWACEKFPPPDEIDVWQTDDAAYSPSMYKPKAPSDG